jgi:hypothetical protein
MATDYRVGIPSIETVISDVGTGFATQYKVPYTITDGPAKGLKSHIMVPAESYNADNVHDGIVSAVAVHQEVMGR